MLNAVFPIRLLPPPMGESSFTFLLVQKIDAKRHAKYVVSFSLGKS